ncbi:MAG: class I SAM-dependent methyltransferase [Cyclobacteriaceae bacterium]
MDGVDNKPRMHFHGELEKDLGYESFLPNETLMKWFEDRYSSSKHLLTLYSICRGLNAQNVLEIGFGRSSFVLIKGVAENGGNIVCCDQKDFRYVLNDHERKVVKYVAGDSEMIWKYHVPNDGFDFVFLDYFSDESLSGRFIKSEISKSIGSMKSNGIIAIHDSIVEKYSLMEVLESLKKNRLGIIDRSIEILSLPYNYGLALLRVKKSQYEKLPDQFLKK